MTILDKIIARKIEEVAERKLQVSIKELEMNQFVKPRFEWNNCGIQA
jgi:hypothetical protein